MQRRSAPFTGRTNVLFDETPEDAEAFRRELQDLICAGGFRSFPSRIADIATLAVDILERNNLPSDARKLYRLEAGRWIEVGQHDSPRIAHGSLLAIVERHHDQDSLLWYAAKVLVLIRFMDDAIRRGNPSNAARWAFDLGSLLRESQLATDWKEAALEGRRIREGRRSHHRGEQLARNAEWTRWQRQADKIVANYTGRSRRPRKREIVRLVKQSLGLQDSIRTIERRIRV